LMRMKPKILLLQARNPEDPMAEHELNCFVEVAELPKENIIAYDLCKNTADKINLAGYDALMVGGSGDYYVSEGNLPGFESLLDFLRKIVEQGMPMFASCFGYQCMVKALGGQIKYDPDNTEVGTYELELTDEGAADPLFKNLPKKFWGQMGHKDRALRQPDGLPNFASSKCCPLQAFRIPGKPIWATQFHPELTRESNLERFRHYVDGYAAYMDPEETKKVLNRFREGTESSALLKQFLELVF